MALGLGGGNRGISYLRSLINGVIGSIKTTMTGNETSTTALLVAKAIYDWAVGKFIDLAKIVTTWTATPLDTNIPSEKLVATFIDNVSTKATSKNLFDKNQNFTAGAVQSDGSISIVGSNSNYMTSNYIYLEAGTYYFSSPWKGRYLCFLYNESKEIISGSYQNVPEVYGISFTISVNGFVRVSTSIDIITSGYIQVELGTSRTYYEEYYTPFFKNKIPKNSVEQSSISIDFAKLLGKGLQINKSGDDYTIISDFNSENYLQQRTTLQATNPLFDFVDIGLVNKQTSNLTLYKYCNDDTAGIRELGTIAAGHGYVLPVVTLENHDKVTADLGSIWTDGVYNYTLLQIDGDDLYFGYPYTETEDVVSWVRVDPVANLTHVSGATNTTTVDISTISLKQLYPSVNNCTLKYIIDEGIEITEDGDYYSKELKVIESYNVIGYKELIDYAQANVGVSYKDNIDDIGGSIRIGICYEFKKDGTCIVNHNITALRKIVLGNCLFIIMSPLITIDGHTLYRYMPNVVAKSGIDFANIEDMTNYNTSINYGIDDLVDVTIPPHRSIEWLEDSEGNKVFGFTIGYLIDKSDAKNSSRLANVTQLWEMRDTKKVYPGAFEGEMNIGDYYNFICYRKALNVSEYSDLTAFYKIESGNDIYIYIDCHDTVANKSVKLNEYIGREITVLESNDNFTLHNTIVDEYGILFSVVNNYGYAVLKIS